MKNCRPLRPPERLLCRQRKQNKTHERHWEGKREAHGFTVVSPTSCSLTSEVVLLTCWVSSLTAFAWDQCLKERGIYMPIVLFCIMAERTKHKHEQRSFRFLVERHNTLANGTLAKRFVGETTVHRPERGFFPLPIFPRALMFIAVFLAVFIGIPRFNKEIFFLPP